MQITKLLKQRRIWVAIVGVIVFTLNLLNVEANIDQTLLANLLTSLGEALSALIMAGLALWSYVRPKIINNK